MKYTRLLLIVGVLLLVTILVAACGGKKATEAQTTVEEQQSASSDVESQASAEDDSTSSGAEVSSGPDIPEDVPIKDGYRDFQATSDFTNISYIVDEDVVDVVAWYQEELPQYGWEMSRATDTVVGNTANMSRINAENDRFTLSIQYNPIGLFSVVRLVVVRAQ